MNTKVLLQICFFVVGLTSCFSPSESVSERNKELRVFYLKYFPKNSSIINNKSDSTLILELTDIAKKYQYRNEDTLLHGIDRFITTNHFLKSNIIFANAIQQIRNKKYFVADSMLLDLATKGTFNLHDKYNAELKSWIGEVKYLMGSEYNKAVIFLKEAIELGIKIDSVQLISFCYGDLAEIYRMRKDFDSALIIISKSQELAKRVNSISDMSFALTALSNIYYDMDQIDSLEATLKRRILFYKENPDYYDDYELANEYFFVAEKYRLKNQFTNAKYNYQNAIEIAESIKDTGIILKALASFAESYRIEKNYTGAIALFKSTLSKFRNYKPSYYYGMCYRYLAHTYKSTKELKPYEIYLDSALNYYKTLKGEEIAYLNTAKDLVSCYTTTYRYNEVIRLLNPLIKIADKYDGDLGYIFSEIAHSYRMTSNYPMAYKYFHLALEEAKEKNNHSKISEGYAYMFELLTYQEDYKKAKYQLDSSLIYALKSGKMWDLLRVYDFYADFYLETDDYNKAFQYYQLLIDSGEKINSYRYKQFGFQGQATVILNMNIKQKESLRISNIDQYLKTCLDSSYVYAEKEGSINLMGNAEHDLAKYYLKTKDIVRSTKHISAALSHARAVGDPEILMEYSNTAYTIYDKANNVNLAYANLKLYNHLKDSIYNKKSMKNFAQYEYLIKENKNKVEQFSYRQRADFERKNKELELKGQKRITVVLFMSSIMVLILLIVSFGSWRKAKKAGDEVTKKKEEIDIAYDKLNERNKEILASIQYAKRIQNALLTTDKYISKNIVRLLKDKN